MFETTVSVYSVKLRIQNLGLGSYIKKTDLFAVWIIQIIVTRKIKCKVFVPEFLYMIIESSNSFLGHIGVLQRTHLFIVEPMQSFHNRRPQRFVADTLEINIIDLVVHFGYGCIVRYVPHPFNHVVIRYVVIQLILVLLQFDHVVVVPVQKEHALIVHTPDKLVTIVHRFTKESLKVVPGDPSKLRKR